jgi:plasmid replication initiation protein
MPRLPTLQGDFFIADVSDTSTKELQDFMSRNWFSLSKQRRIKPIEHRFNENWIKITGDSKYGIASIFDHDLILFVISQWLKTLNEGGKIDREFSFTGYSFFKFIGKDRFGGTGYKDLWRAMERLHHTFVETNLRMGDTARHHSFVWLSSIKQLKDGDTHRGYTITMPDWIYDSVLNNKLILTLDEEYFNIRGGLERWLYLYARKSAGWQSSGWAEGLESIYKKSGSAGTFAEFKRSINKLVARGNFLGYTMEPIKYHNQNGIRFQRDNELVKLTSTNRHGRGAKKWRKEITDGRC